MKSIHFRAAAAAAMVCAGVAGCSELTGIVDNFFTVSVLPPPGGGERFGGVQGGQIIATVRVENGANVRTTIDFTFATPQNITARIDPTSIDADLVLEPNESRELPLHITIGPEVSAGALSIDIIANGKSVRTDINNGRVFEDTQTATVGVEIGADEGPPTVVIQDPQSDGQFTGLPIRASALATDDGAVVHVSMQLNDATSVRLWEAGSDDDPVATMSRVFALLTPSVGPNTLTVSARDALGQTGFSTVNFTYQPTGQCEDFTVAPSLSRVTSPPGGPVGFRATITPLPSWSGPFAVTVGRGLIVSASREEFAGDTGPVETILIVNLRSDLVPGQTYNLLVRVAGVTEPERICEASVPLDIVDPGVGGPPIVSIDSPASDYVTSNPNLTFTGSVTDDGTISTVYYRNEFDATSGTVDLVNAQTPSPFAFSQTITLVEGLNVIRVSATDDQGRRGSDAVAVTYDPNATEQCSEFTMSASPGELVTVLGGTDYAGILINRTAGFDGDVTLSIEEPFATEFFSEVAFTPNPTGGNSTMSVTVSDGEGSIEWVGRTFTFTVVGTSATSQCMTAFTVEVLDS